MGRKHATALGFAHTSSCLLAHACASGSRQESTTSSCMYYILNYSKVQNAQGDSRGECLTFFLTHQRVPGHEHASDVFIDKDCEAAPHL